MRSSAGNASTTFGRAAAVFDLITSSTSGQLDRDTADHHRPPTPSIDDDPTQRRGATRSDHRAMLAAGVAIAARNARTPVAQQILTYQMLDDRTIEPDPEIEPFAIWTYANSFTGLNALLTANRGARTSCVRNPFAANGFRWPRPCVHRRGELDIFRDESILYALNLVRAGVSTELHVRAGWPSRI
jgi:hypothetical protein